MNKLIYILLISITLLSCRATKVINVEDTQKDSTNTNVKIEYIEKVRVDTVEILIPAETKEVIKKDSSFLETSFAKSFAKIKDDGLLYHTLQNKDVKPKVEVLIKEVEMVRDSIVYVDKLRYKVEEVPVRMPLRWHEKLFFYLGIVLSTIFIAYISFKLIKL